MEMEPGYEALVDPRSGFSCRGMEGHEVVSLYEYKAPNGVTITGRWNPNIAMSKHYMDCVTRKCIDLEPKHFDCDVIEGKIDSDYRKGVGVIINSRDKRTFLIKAGTRIAQMTFHKVETVQWEEAEELSETDRKGGFGSSGTK
jgi:dUTPase